MHQTTLDGDYIPVGSDKASADDSRHKRELMDCRKVSAEQIRNIICNLDLQTDVTDDYIDGWVKGTVSVRALRKMIRSDILDGFKYDSEIGVNVSYCCDSFFDEKLSEGFADDDAVRRHLHKDRSELLNMMTDTFSEGFSIICLLECLDMHTEASDFTAKLSDEIDRSIRERAFCDDFVLKCLEGLSQRIRLALEDGDPCGWMNPEVIGSVLDADVIRRCCSE